MSRRNRPPRERPADPDTVDAPWRVFLAVPLPEPVRAAVAEQVAALAAEEWPVRWVAPEGAHLTLHFLGETTRDRVELLRLGLPRVVAAHDRFDLRTANLGVFPNLKRPRVVWLGLHGPAHRLETLRADLGAAVADLGYPVEPEFRPHVTLGRVRDQGTAAMPLRNLPEAIRRRCWDPAKNDFGGPPPLPLPVREVELVRSRLSHAGARYETIARFPLAEPGAAGPGR